MYSVALCSLAFLAWAALFLAACLVLAYRRASLASSSCVLGVLLFAYWALGTFPEWWKIAVSVPYGLLLLLNVRPLRLRAMTRPFLRTYRRLLPAMSATEREALDAGTVWWDGELFTGGPIGRSSWRRKRRRSTGRSRPFSTDPAKSCAPCSMTGTSRTPGPTCPRPCGPSSSPAVSSP